MTTGMAKHKKRPKVCRWGCALARVMASGGGSRACAALEAELPSAVKAALRTHTKKVRGLSRDILEDGCFALAALVEKGPPTAAAAVEKAGCIELGREALQGKAAAQLHRATQQEQALTVLVLPRSVQRGRLRGAVQGG